MLNTTCSRWGALNLRKRFSANLSARQGRKGESGHLLVAFFSVCSEANSKRKALATTVGGSQEPPVLLWEVAQSDHSLPVPLER